MINHTPAYNLMVVLKETGLKADVLRAWEKRYHLPHPNRSSGGHRLYSDYDIATVKWLQNRQVEGLRISQAVQLWNDILKMGQDPLEQVVHSQVNLEESASHEASLDSFRQQWLKECLAFDAMRAEDALNQAFAIYPIERVCTQVLQQGLNQIGQGWYQGKVSVQQEHFVSELAIRRVETLINATPRPTRHHTILTGCPAEELHTFPVLLLSLFLQRAGYRVVYLGANIPLQQMDSAVAYIHPDLVVLSCQQLSSAAVLSDAARLFQEKNIPLAYGGLIFNSSPELRKHIPAIFLGETIEEAVEQVETLLQSPTAAPVLSPNEKYRNLADQFKRLRSIIEQALYPVLESEAFQSDTIETVNAFFGTRLEASLKLGNPAFIEGDLVWIEGLLSSRGLPVSQLVTYLSAYINSTLNILGETGKPLSEWIKGYLSQRENRSENK